MAIKVCSPNFQISYRILNPYVLRTLLLYHMEQDCSTPTQLILNWSPRYISYHVLRILDSVIKSLRMQMQPNYFFLSANLLVNPGHLCEDDFVLEASKVQAHVLRMFDESLTSLKGNQEFGRFLSMQATEMALLYRWKDLLKNLTPPPSTRGRRFCFAASKAKKEVVYTQYTSRQLDYIGILLNNMLSVKQMILKVRNIYD